MDERLIRLTRPLFDKTFDNKIDTIIKRIMEISKFT